MTPPPHNHISCRWMFGLESCPPQGIRVEMHRPEKAATSCLLRRGRWPVDFVACTLISDIHCQTCPLILRGNVDVSCSPHD
jgi:hypothetical protein